MHSTRRRRSNKRAQRHRAALLALGLVLPLACAQGVQDSPVDDTSTAGSDEAGSGNFAGSSGSGASGAPAAHAGSGVSGSSTGGKTGAAGSAGKGGSAGSAGKGGATGSGGKAGAGSAGAATGGSAGASNGGSTGIAGSANGGTGGGATVAGFSVQYKNAITNPSGAYIGAEIMVNNAGPNSLAISALKVRYYFTDEPKKVSQMTINFSHVSLSGSQPALTVNTVFTGMAPTAPTADTFIEFSFSAGSHPTLAPGEALDFAWQMQGPDPSKDTFNQANDYSWDASKTSMTNWEHIVLLQGTNPLWGTPP